METDRLAELIDNKHAVLAQLLRLGREQSNLIGDGDITNLLVVLSAKQSLLNQLQTIEGHLAPFRQQDPAARRWSSPAARHRCAEVARRCEDLLHDIVEIEKRSESEMVRRRDAAAARLQSAGSAAQARAAYQNQPKSSPRQLDLTSEVP
jgi:hypothetical protein